MGLEYYNKTIEKPTQIMVKTRKQSKALNIMLYYPINKKKINSLVGGFKSFGSLIIIYDIDLSVPQITGKATLYGITIGTFLINSDNPLAVIIGSVGIAQAEVTLTVDFEKKEFDYLVNVDTFNYNIHEGNGRLFTW